MAYTCTADNKPTCKYTHFFSFHNKVLKIFFPKPPLPPDAGKGSLPLRRLGTVPKVRRTHITVICPTHHHHLTYARLGKCSRTAAQLAHN